MRNTCPHNNCNERCHWNKRGEVVPDCLFRPFVKIHEPGLVRQADSFVIYNPL